MIEIDEESFAKHNVYSQCELQDRLIGTILKANSDLYMYRLIEKNQRQRSVVTTIIVISIVSITIAILISIFNKLHKGGME